ncbi:MAG: hypothetical protein IPL03_09460 [Sterolibacteriaceae bacterium]|nr:hypothetical protein [Candidatus Methylophosphatis haderslevensis]
MLLRKIVLALWGCLIANVSNAIDPEYYAPIKGYAAQLDREPIDVRNIGIYAVAARSKAHRATHEAMSNVRTAIANKQSVSANPDDNGGDINIASPHIEGGNRGNITVIVERGAINGNITTVGGK